MSVICVFMSPHACIYAHIWLHICIHGCILLMSPYLFYLSNCVCIYMYIYIYIAGHSFVSFSLWAMIYNSNTTDRT